MSSYFETKKRLLKMQGNPSEGKLKHSKTVMNMKFKDDPSYRLAILKKGDLTEEPIDVRVINNPNDLTKESMYFRPETVVDIGSYLYIEDDKKYIVKEFETNLISPMAKIELCEQRLKWDGVPIQYQEGFPCTLDNDSYGSKTVADNDFITMKDSKAKIITQANEYTRQIRPDWRFIFNNSDTDIYKIIDVTTSIPAGLVTMTAKKDTLLAEDDLVNNLAFQKKDNFKKDEDTTTYSIVGDTYIKLDKTKEFKIDPVCYSDNLTWEIDNSKAEIVNSDNNSCVIKAIKRNSIIKVIAKVNGTKIASTFVEVQ